MKDILIQKSYIILGFLFVGFFFIILSGAFEGLPVAVLAAIFSHFLIVVASKSDEKNNNGRMLASFPLRRIDIVTAKYVGIVMFIAIAFLLTMLWRVAAGLVLPESELPWFDTASTVWAIGLLLAFNAIYFPIFFAAGSRIIQVLDLVVILAVGGTIILVLRVLEWMSVNTGQFVERMLKTDNLAFTASVLGGSIVLCVLSWGVSVYIYERKNL